MLLKLKKTPHVGQKDVVVQNKYGAFGFSGVGAAVDLPDAAAHQIMADWPGCFEPTAPAAKVVKPKATSVEVDDEAALEATKVVSGYKNKSVE